MSARAQELAQQFEQAVEEFISVVEPLSEAEWRRLCPNEERLVCALTRHVAYGIPFEMNVFRELAAGRQPETITRDQLAVINADGGEKWADCDQQETIQLLREFTAEAAAEVRQLSDEQLARSGKYVEDIPEPWTVEQWLERILVGHVTGHLASIRAALEAPQAATT